MEFYRAENADDFIAKVNELLIKALSSQDKIYLPAGKTPIALYENWEAMHPEFLNEKALIQIDELHGQDPIFKPFFEEHLPSYVEQFEWINEQATQAGVALLGLGLNGHVGFHEPHMPNDFAFGKVDLDEKTCDTLDVEYPAQGITYGVGSFAKCETVIIVIQGAHKKSVLEQLKNEDQKIPASAFYSHANCHVVYDVGE